MAINRIEIYTCSFCSSGGSVDEEEKRIMRRLLQYGIKPTGQKNIDKPKLHEIELQKAKLEDYVSNKFLTVTKSEQEKIQAKKKEKRKERNPEKYTNSEQAQKVMGEQIYLAIKMKKKKKF